MKNVTILRVAVPLAVVAMLVVTAQAAPTPTVYEPFNYGDATDLNGQGGSTEDGFATGVNWTAYDVELSADDTSLLYPAAVPLSGTEVGDRVKHAYSGQGQAYRELATHVDMGANNTFYMSALFVQGYTGGGNYRTVMSVAQTSDAHPVKFGLGKVAGGKFYVEIDGTSNSCGTFIVDTTYFLVVKVESVVTGEDKVSLKVYDAAATDISEPTTDAGWDIIAQKDVSHVLDKLWVRVYSYPTDGQVDEFRMGDSWEDVTGVPEPATLVLLGIGGIGVLLRRRRK